MNLLKKIIISAFVSLIAIINFKIIIDYEIIRPAEKYNITWQRKTVAKVIDFNNVHPEKTVEIEEESIENIEEENVVTKSEETIENTESFAEAEEKNGTESDEANFEALASALSDSTIIEASVETYQVIEPSKESISETSKSTASNIVSTAMQYKGYKYVSGGASPETGFDCSGFTKYIYGLFGITLNRVASEQANNGTEIRKEELQPGDLVLFSYYGSSSIGHSGIYIGNGNFIHAANPTRGVVVDTLESGYYLDNYVTARRVF